MKKQIALLLCLGAFALNTFAQTDKPKNDKSAKETEKNAAAKTAVTIKSDATPLELAKAALSAHGGDKFKTMKSVTQIGTADIAMPNSTQTMTVSYSIVASGDKSRFEINSPFANFQQIFDGVNLYSSMGGADIPPLMKLGMNLLTKIEEKGYTVSALPDKKKRRGFKITTPEGYATDFYIDATTGQVYSYEAKFTVRNREVSTATENDKFREVEGVLIPEKFSQRFDIGGNTFYANFKAKEVRVNTTIADDVFAIPQ